MIYGKIIMADITQGDELLSTKRLLSVIVYLQIAGIKKYIYIDFTNMLSRE